MKIIAVDSDPAALSETVESLKREFAGGEIVAFSDAMSTYKYCLNHAREIAVAFLPIILKPFDGLKLAELLSTMRVPVRVVFTPIEQSVELISLVNESGCSGYILKPVTQTALREKARELTNGCWAESCRECTLFWCESRKDDTA